MANVTGRSCVLSPDERRELILRALSGEPHQYLADQYGISISRVRHMLYAARTTTDADAKEAAKELEFVWRVLEILQNGEMVAQCSRREGEHNL